MILFGLKTCDTCRKVLRLLPDAEFRDVRTDGVPANLLADAHARFGKELLNTRSTTWRGLTDTERGRDPLDLLAAHPTLMKRPLILVGDEMHLGWGKDVQDRLLG